MPQTVDPGDADAPTDTQPEASGPERECEPDTTRPCGPSTAIGACTLVRQRVSMAHGAPVSAVESGEEICNGLDDDCDGNTDESLRLTDRPRNLPGARGCVQFGDGRVRRGALVM